MANLDILIIKKLICDIIFDSCDNYVNGFARVKLNNKFGFINEQGLCSEIKYTNLCIFTNGFAIVEINNCFGYINENFEEICEIKYDRCWNYHHQDNFNDKFSIVRLNSREDYMDIVGNLKTNFKYDICEIFYNGFGFVESNNKCGYIDKNFKEIVKCECNSNTEAEIKLEKYIFNQNRIQKIKTII